MNKQKGHAVISLSGGMDSSTLLLKCLEEYDSVTAISFDYGQKHRVELEKAKSLIEYLEKEGYNTTYQVIKLDGLSDLLNSNLVEGGDEVPEGHYQEENMKDTVVPNRNKIFSSIIQAIALSRAKQTQKPVDIAMGIHSGDHDIYPDCRPKFRNADQYAFTVGNWDAEKVKLYTPYLEGDKYTILKDGERLCNILNLDFDEVYSRTNTSYKPIFSNGEWYSDFKSASSVERIEAFIKLGRPDPAKYAEGENQVSWKYVVDNVTKVLNSYSN
jgi:7-cyano-7-deazaguanine synthase